MQEDRSLDYYIKKLFNQLNMAEFATEVDVQKEYHYLTGDLIFSLTTMFRYRDGRLTLRFPSAALKHEMTCRREGLQQKLNEQLGGNVVKKIVIL